MVIVLDFINYISYLGWYTYSPVLYPRIHLSLLLMQIGNFRIYWQFSLAVLECKKVAILANFLAKRYNCVYLNYDYFLYTFSLIWLYASHLFIILADYYSQIFILLAYSWNTA